MAKRKTTRKKPVRRKTARANPTRKRRASAATRRRKNPSSASSKRRAAAKKAARTRAANARKRSRAAKKAAMARKRTVRKNPPRRTSPKRRRSPARRPRGAARSYARRYSAKRRPRRNPAKRKPGAGVKALASARRTIKYQRKHPSSGAAKGFLNRFNMRSNPGTLGQAIGAAVPVAASLYGSRLVVNKFGPKIPGMSSLGAFAKPAQAGGLLLVAHLATKRVKPLRKFRSGIMIGTGVNLVDSVLAAVAPDNVKSMFGLADDGIYDSALNEYVGVDEYVGVGNAPPIDDDIALDEYVGVGAIESELGAIESELGAEEALGSFDDRNLGGVHRGEMAKKGAKPMPMVGKVPDRSFTRQVPKAGEGFDDPKALYQGIFAGGVFG